VTFTFTLLYCPHLLSDLGETLHASVHDDVNRVGASWKSTHGGLCVSYGCARNCVSARILKNYGAVASAQ